MYATMNQTTGQPVVIGWRPELGEAFERLNREWIEAHFRMEAPDLAVLRDPERAIVRPGGEVFFVLVDGVPHGTCAMIPHPPGVYELAKMAVASSARGRGYGDLLVQAALGWARTRGAHHVELLTNSRLAPALALYDKHGFVRVPVAAREGGYERADVKMVRVLRRSAPLNVGAP